MLHTHRDQRGMALIMALLALVVLSLVVAGVMMSVNTDTKIAGHDVRANQAFWLAEAGVAEAQARIRAGDVPNNNNPRMVSQIFLTVPGSVPALGTDSIGLATQQPSGQWLAYSTDGRSDRALTVKYKTNADRTEIYRYDSTKNPAIQTASGFPIYTITATGRKGTDRAQIITDVVMQPFNLNCKAALAADVGINFSGNSEICGWNHSIDTPAGTKGRPPCDTWEVGSGNLPGAWSSGTINGGGSSVQEGNPPTLAGQAGFYDGPWQCLGMSQASFFEWVGAPYTTEPSPPRGIVYLDNDDITQNHTGNYQFNGGNGEGLLYIDGDVHINGNFNYVGLIYIEGDLQINGTCWILGSIIVKGITTIKIANGDCTILYSSDAIQQKISRYGGTLTTLSWREN